MSKHRTPLRYPGGKQKLSPFILEILQANELLGGQYVEPYAGGAGVAIDLLLGGQVERIHLNDSCKAVYLFWKSVRDNPEQLCRKISRASLNVEEWRRQKVIISQPDTHDETEVGFSLFFLNRVNRSGIVSGGLIGGLDQSGTWKMDARFNRNDLINRVEAIAKHAKSIFLRNWDAERFLLEYVPRIPHRSLIYCDPPYFNKADRLYLNHYNPGDHERIAKIIQGEVKHHWIVSYDGVPEILGLYAKQRSFLYDLQYNAANAYKGTEAFFFSDKLCIPTESRLSFISEALKRAA
jgi:DNA adenine methylase